MEQVELQRINYTNISIPVNYVYSQISYCPFVSSPPTLFLFEYFLLI